MSNGFVNFGCFNNMAKITSASLDLWADVLLAVPDSKLSLLTPLGQVMDHLRARFAIKGIEVERLIFVQRTSPVEYLKLYHQIDICLDPLPYTGHSTTLDALWMGAVLITLKGRTVASRGTASPLSNLDLTELIASTPEQYVQIAARLAGDVEGLAKLRSQLRQRMRTSPICDERRFTTDLEIAYRRMWKSWCESP
jgi:predicted O-linked N-acetylglucosamine transferase (SPINDLY family)